MPKRTIYEAVTERLEILDKDGKADKALVPRLSDEQFRDLYRNMVWMRRFDEKALNLQRQGRLGTYGSLRGQEAAQAGLALAMEEVDWMVPSFREHGIMMLRGIPGHLIYAFWKGDERGSRFPEGTRCLPPAIPVGSQLLHAVGVGLALKLRGEDAVAVGFAGDGASSEGDFHEALNFAGVFRPKTVFYIQNNQWAISVPFRQQTAAGSIAQRAHGYGIPGIQVDGNDVLACYAAAKEALDRARSGGGATLIEAHTYRMENHTTADDAKKYRPPEELEYWAQRDPLARMRAFLESRKLWSEAEEEAFLEEASARVERDVEALEAMPEPHPSEIFDSMYSELPWNLVEQREALLNEVGR
ncbi:MAG: pyruvate dehydrogenase (acetyl-transferring) E1 component subunit alpha [Acidobacteriota bacterium]